MGIVRDAPTLFILLVIELGILDERSYRMPFWKFHDYWAEKNGDGTESFSIS
jgi:hypothetical protein